MKPDLTELRLMRAAQKRARQAARQAKGDVLVKVWRNSLEAITERRAQRTGSIDANVPKLSLEKARRIRRALRSGVDAEVLAEAYGVRLTTIRKVQRNESYPEAQP